MRNNLLILNYEYPPLGGGAATATYNLVKELGKNKGIDVTLVTSSVGKDKREKMGENITIEYLDIKKEGELHNQSNKNLIIYSVRTLFWLLKNRKKYDLIHAFFGTPCGFLAMLTGKPYIVSLRGSDVPFYSEKYKVLDKYIFQHLDKLIWRKAKFVVANSAGLRDLAYKTDERNKIEVIYNGVDVEKFKPGRKDKEFVVISTSRLIERKGIDYLIKAFGKFSEDKEDVRLDLYGDGNQRDELESLVKEFKLEEKVIFHGETEREELTRVTPKADVFALPSKNEGMSNSLLEAMASGLAVIATDVGGTRELVDEENGFVVEKESVEDIQRALEKLYRDKKLLENMGKESRKRAVSMSWENMAGEYTNLYKHVLS